MGATVIGRRRAAGVMGVEVLHFVNCFGGGHVSVEVLAVGGGWEWCESGMGMVKKVGWEL